MKRKRKFIQKNCGHIKAQLETLKDLFSYFPAFTGGATGFEAAVDVGLELLAVTTAALVVGTGGEGPLVVATDAAGAFVVTAGAFVVIAGAFVIAAFVTAAFTVAGFV